LKTQMMIDLEILQLVNQTMNLENQGETWMSLITTTINQR